MSVFFENEFKNESENEIKNESENRCIMLPGKIKMKGCFIVLTGSKLKKYVEKHLKGLDEERDFVKRVVKYCRSSENMKVYCIPGLPSTGKTTGLLQAIRKLGAYDKSMYLSVSEEIEIEFADLVWLLNSYMDNMKYIFLDGVSSTEGFVGQSSCLPMGYLWRGKRIVVSGADSYAMYRALLEGLRYHYRVDDISFLAYREARRTTGMEFDSYLTSGGLYESKKYQTADGLQNYIEDSVVKNILSTVQKNLYQFEFEGVSDTELRVAAYLILYIIAYSWKEKLNFYKVLEDLKERDDSVHKKKITGILEKELGITFEKVEWNVISEVLWEMEGMKMIIECPNLAENKWLTWTEVKYVITSPFLANGIYQSMVRAMEEAGEMPEGKTEDKKEDEIKEFVLESMVISHAAFLSGKKCYFYREGKAEIALILLDQEITNLDLCDQKTLDEEGTGLHIDEKHAFLVEVSGSNCANTAHEQGHWVREVTEDSLIGTVKIEERIILYRGRANKKKGLVNVVSFLNRYLRQRRCL